MKRQPKVAAILTAAILATGIATSASALDYSGAKYGSHIVTSGANVTLTDTKADGKFPAVNYKYNGGSAQDGFANKHGYNSSVTKTAPNTVTAIQPCISRTSPLPMDCGSWIY